MVDRRQFISPDTLKLNASKCVFIKNKAGKCKLPPWYSDIREKGQRDHWDQSIYVCVYSL